MPIVHPSRKLFVRRAFRAATVRERSRDCRPINDRQLMELSSRPSFGPDLRLFSSGCLGKKGNHDGAESTSVPVSSRSELFVAQRRPVDTPTILKGETAKTYLPSPSSLPPQRESLSLAPQRPIGDWGGMPARCPWRQAARLEKGQRPSGDT